MARLFTAGSNHEDKKLKFDTAFLYKSQEPKLMHLLCIPLNVEREEFVEKKFCDTYILR